MRILVVLCFALILAGCADEKTLRLTTFEQTQNTLSYCKNNACPDISITYPVAHDATASPRINHKIDSTLARMLTSNPEKEPKTTLTATLNDFAKSYRQFETEFTKEHFVTFQANITMALSFQNEQLLSFKTDFYFYTGGAHGYGGIAFLNVHPKTGATLTQKDIINDKTAFTAIAEQAFREEYDIPKNDDINSTGFWFENNQFALPKSIGFTATEVVLIYNPYDVAAYAEGVIEICLPITTVQPFLNTTFI